MSIDRKGNSDLFLLASLQNYLSNEAERANCLKRGGGAKIVYLDIERAEERYSVELVETLTPEKIFDARWAMALLGEAMNRLSREYQAQGKTTTFEVLNAFLDPINSKELPTYEDVADRLRISVGSVKTLVHRLRKQYTAFVREEINRTVSDSADVNVEIHELCEALIAAEGSPLEPGARRSWEGTELKGRLRPARNTRLPDLRNCVFWSDEILSGVHAAPSSGPGG